MRATGLPARLLYVFAATPLAAVSGFYLGILLLTRVFPELQGLPRIEVGWLEFVLSLLLAGVLAFTVFWLALTLPRLRRRHRAGRAWRIVSSAVVVLVAAVLSAAEGVPLRYTIVLMLWLAVVLTFTFIRYGVLDNRRHSRRPRVESHDSGVRSTS